MEWIKHAQPYLLTALISRTFKKRLLRHVFGYIALFSLIVVIKVGFLVTRPCERGVFITEDSANNTDGTSQDQAIPYHLNLSQKENDFVLQTTSQRSQTHTKFKVLPQGESVQMGHPDILIPTAVRLLDFPEADDFTILLHAWTRNFSNSQFTCCLLRSLNDEFNDIVSARAISHKQNVLSNSDSKNNNYNYNNDNNNNNNNLNTKVWSSEFYCSIPKGVVQSTNHLSGFNYVTFSSKNSCNKENVVPRDVLKIESKQRVFRSVGLCVSLQRAFVNAEYFVEWLEWYRLHGVTEVFVYYDHGLHKAIERVLQYYKMVGFVQIFRFTHPEYYYRESLPVFNEEMAGNDCRHRMSHFDYVITLDVSELIAPKQLKVDIYDILKNASKEYPDAGVFQIHSYQAILDWRPSKKSPLHLARQELQSKDIKMGENTRLSRWAYMPNRAQVTTKRMATPKKPFTSQALSKSMYTLLRFVRCHPKIVQNCTDSDSKVKDDAVSRFQNALITGMREIPLEQVLKYNKRYVDSFNKVRIPGDGYFIGGG